MIRSYSFSNSKKIMTYQIDLQTKFEKLLSTKHSQLKPINKWRQTMWHIDEKIIVSLVHLSNKSKFCFFNNPVLKLDKLQRWGSSVYSQNLEIEQDTNINWNDISNWITDTIKNHDSLK